MQFIQPAPPALPGELRALVTHYNTRHHFLTAIEQRFAGSPADQELIAFAYDYFAKLFHGKRRHCGMAFMNGHLVPVATIVSEYWSSSDVELVIAALGHDVLEDFPELVTYDVISKLFGTRTANLIFSATKPPLNGLRKNSVEYSLLIVAQAERGGLEGVFLKCLCDRLHNMITLWGTPQKKRYKIWETEQYFIPLARKWSLPVDELQFAIAEQRQRLHIDDNLLLSQ